MHVYAYRGCVQKTRVRELAEKSSASTAMNTAIGWPNLPAATPCTSATTRPGRQGPGLRHRADAPHASGANFFARNANSRRQAEPGAPLGQPRKGRLRNPPLPDIF